ncbi:MAG: hypothetical protein AAGD00_04730 [Planctomycetota bacterium]
MSDETRAIDEFLLRVKRARGKTLTPEERDQLSIEIIRVGGEGAEGVLLVGTLRNPDSPDGKFASPADAAAAWRARHGGERLPSWAESHPEIAVAMRLTNSKPLPDDAPTKERDRAAEQAKSEDAPAPATHPRPMSVEESLLNARHKNPFRVEGLSAEPPGDWLLRS